MDGKVCKFYYINIKLSVYQVPMLEYKVEALEIKLCRSDF